MQRKNKNRRKEGGNREDRRKIEKKRESIKEKGRERCGRDTRKVRSLLGKLFGNLNFAYVKDLLLCTYLC